jgi:UDP-N-acetylglucosamine--N-acetylmuramyl-(pentapeptide) pyrophosphoryl-undecaprenol N-acetylglucosamine transferase
MDKSKRIFITGGHATPAIACINELKSRGYIDLVFIGQKKSLLFDKNTSAEYRLITETIKIPFKSIIAGKLSLFLDFKSLIWLLRLPIGFLQSFFWIVSQKPALVLTFGSHVGVPVVWWAHRFKIPVVAHEQTVTIGRSNRTIQKYATKVCYSWEGSIAEAENSDKFVYTGNPIRKELLEHKLSYFKFSNPSRKTVFITGGNQGAHAINEWVFANLSKLVLKYNVIHQTGSNSIYNDFGHASTLAEEYNRAGVVYIPQNYIFVEEMSDAYHVSTAIISRGGANTATEVLALQKKAIIIPLMTSSGNEQFLNGKLLEDLGLALVIKQEELGSIDILERLEACENLHITDAGKVEELSASHRNAEKRIVDIVESLIK